MGGSTKHRENILWEKFKHVGLAWYRKKGSNMYHWVQVFGGTREGVEPCMPTSVQPPSSGGGSGGGSCAGKSKFKTKAKRESQCKTKCSNKGKSSYEYSNKKCYCC